MKLFVIVIAATALLCAAPHAEEAEVLFADDFEEELSEAWTWLREDPDDWRIADGALEIRARPGNAQTVRNALLLPVPEVNGAGLAIEVTVTFTAPLTQQFEQAGITWYADEAPVMKLVHELIDDAYFIVPGHVPTETKVMDLRLEVRGEKYVAKFREDGAEEYEIAAEGDLIVGNENHISLQTYHGPADADHWMRFTNFRVLPISNGA